MASVAYDAGGNELVVGEGSSVTIWATDTWTVQTTLPADGPVTSVAFNPAGTEVAFGTSDDQDQAEAAGPSDESSSRSSQSGQHGHECVFAAPVTRSWPPAIFRVT